MFLTRAKIGQRSKHRSLCELPFRDLTKLRAEALILRCFWRLSLILGPQPASNLAAKLTEWLGKSDHDVIRRIRRNLQIALPDQKQTSLDQLAKESASNLARVVAEYPHLRRMTGAEMHRFIEFVADSPEVALSPERPPALYIGIHQANWEILSALAVPLGKPMTVVVSPLSNPFVHRLISQARADRWVEQAERDQATRSLVRSLQSGRSVGLLADHRYEGGKLVPFFGRDAMTAIGPAKLAIKFGCDLVPTRVERIGPVRFRITTFGAIRPDQAIADGQEQAVDMMRRVNRHFEAWIKERPGEWMCLKRRWPKGAYQSEARLPRSSPDRSRVVPSEVAAS